MHLNIWKYHCTQLDNTTTNEKKEMGDVSRPAELTNR
jgi:hypothetical protein